MWTVKSKLYYILYQLTAAGLPISQRMELAKKLRGFWARRIATCGKNVNIEKTRISHRGLPLGIIPE